VALEDWAGAEAAFAALATDHPDHELTGEGLYLLGEARVRSGELEAALEPLETLRRTRPDHASTPKALFRLAQTYGGLELWPACEQALDELARRDPDFELAAEVDLWRGRALAARGDRRGARAAFDRVVARDKTVLAARARIGIGQLALAAGEPEDALAEFLKVALLFADPEEVAHALYLAGTALEQMDDTDRARAQYVELIESHPDTRAAELARQRLRQLGG
jgi:TolA-binding protein